MTAMTIYADEITEGDVLDSGAVVTAIDVFDTGAFEVYDLTVVYDDGAVEVLGFAYDYALPILRAVD